MIPLLTFKGQLTKSLCIQPYGNDQEQCCQCLQSQAERYWKYREKTAGFPALPLLGNLLPKKRMLHTSCLILVNRSPSNICEQDRFYPNHHGKIRDTLTSLEEKCHIFRGELGKSTKGPP